MAQLRSVALLLAGKTAQFSENLKINNEKAELISIATGETR